jgi:hypothetical protein
MKFDVMVQGLHARHQFRLPWDGVLAVLSRIETYENILGPGLSHAHPKVVSVTPQLALPHYPQ